METKRPRSSDDNNGVNNNVNNNDRPADLCEKKRKTEDPSDVDNDRPAAHSTESAETNCAPLNLPETDVDQPSDDVNNNDRPVAHSTESTETCPARLNSEMEMDQPTGEANENHRPAAHWAESGVSPVPGSSGTGSSQLDLGGINGQPPSDDFNNDDRPAARSGLALLNAYEWLEVGSCLNFYENATIRFVSGALNAHVQRYASTLPLRVIAAVTVRYKEAEQRCFAYACKPDLTHVWPDLIFEARASPESMLREVLTRCDGLAVNELQLRNLPYTEQLLNVVEECLPSVAVSELYINGVASGHERVPRVPEVAHGLRSASYQNDANNRDAAVFLSACASRRIPNATLRFAADVSEEAIVNYLFCDNTPRITRQFGIISLHRSLSENFFEMIVKRCRKNVCRSLRFGMAGILTDPTDAKYERYVVERDDNAALYRFEKASEDDAPFSLIVGCSTTT